MPDCTAARVVPWRGTVWQLKIRKVLFRKLRESGYQGCEQMSHDTLEELTAEPRDSKARAAGMVHASASDIVLQLGLLRPSLPMILLST